MVILDNIDQSTASVLPKDSGLQVLAQIKQWHVVGGTNELIGASTPENSSAQRLSSRPSEEAVDRAIQTYRPETFTKGTLPLDAARSLSMLNGQRVMVEWRYFSSETTTRRDPARRLGGLVSLLNRNRLYERFLTLPCLRGLAVDSSNCRIGIVFSLDGVTGGQSIESLQDVIRRVAQPVSVGQRFKLARDIATAVHHLHSVRWLHKSIRSDNILCFSSVIKGLLDAETASTAAWSKVRLTALKQPGAPTVVNGSTSSDNTAILPSMTKCPDPLPQFYLVGWDLSRPDHASELSESLSVSTAGYRSRRDAIRMYSHPYTHAESTAKQQYRPQFDIYSLGLVLLEIGLWRTIDTIWKQCQGDAGFRLLVRTEYCDRLLGKMGEVYWRAVQRCLNDDFGVGEENPDGGDLSPTVRNLSLQESFEKNVVCELERCHA
jgi:serine/threonine protein kinase